MRILSRIKREFHRAISLLSVLATLAIVLMMFTIMADTFARWSSVSLQGIYELDTLLIGMAIYLGIAFTQSQRANISARFLEGRLPKRISAIIDGLLLSISGVLFGWASYLYCKAAYNALVTHEVVQGFVSFPFFPLKLVMFLGVATLTIQCVIDATNSVLSTVGSGGSKTATQDKDKETRT